MSRLLELCLPHLLTYGQYIQRLDSVLTSSEDIQTMEDAKIYWQKHFGNKTLNVVVKSGKNPNGTPKKIPIKVFFDKDNNHAFTEDELKTGDNALRLFNLKRAQAMDSIIPTIQAPHIRFKHHGADLLLERVVDGHHFTIVLQWQNFQGRYRFQSAHHKSIEQVTVLYRGKDTQKGEGPL